MSLVSLKWFISKKIFHNFLQFCDLSDIPYLKLILKRRLIVAGGSISSLIVKHLTVKKQIPYHDIDICCFEELIGKIIEDVLKESQIEFKKIGLDFICISKI